MPKIKKLSTELVNQIKAGEVVERPVSIVKELIENSLDAGAQNIVIELIDSGKQLIRISDDGFGISASELELALERHATSKIKSFDDLQSLHSFGFRGEALPSIAAVSHFTLRSRTQDQNLGRELVVNHGRKISEKDLTLSIGTVIQIKDLFLELPARLKFLKSTATEFSHIHDFLISTAFAYPKISFKLCHNGRDIFNYKSKNSLQERFEDIVGHEQKNYHYVEYSREDFSLKGFCARPELCSSLAQYFITFVNGRYVKDRVIRSGVLQAYQGLLIKGLTPSSIIFIEVNPSWVDVNAHPSKTEIRFYDATSIQELVARSLQEKIKNNLNEDLANPLIPKFNPNKFEQIKTPFIKKDFQHLSQMRTQPEDFLQTKQIQKPIIYSSNLENLEKKDHKQSVNTQKAETLFQEKKSGIFTQAKYLGQFSNCYLLLEQQKELWILDQHAFHERILFEDYLKNHEKGSIPKQMLLVPIVIPCLESISNIVEEQKNFLSSLGFEVEVLKNHAIAIHFYPIFLQTQKITEIFEDILVKFIAIIGGINQRIQHPLLDKVTQLRHTDPIYFESTGNLAQLKNFHLFFATLACHSAIRAGEAMSTENVQHLLQRSTDVDFFAHCPHGRPVLRRFTERDVATWFLRT